MTYLSTRRFVRLSTFILCTLICAACKQDHVKEQKPGWPEVTSETKPWTRWWWHGNALTKEGITAEMEAFRNAGIGGVEITPIYGVAGYEDKFIDYLSPQWMELLMHVLKEGERLGIGIDMATGTGWPFGGPWVTNEDACKNLRYKAYEVAGGTTLPDKIEFIQQPYLRLVGNRFSEAQRNAKSQESLLTGSSKNIKITDIIDPVAENKNLQALAIDQVQFEKPLPLLLLMAYGSEGEVLDLTPNVDATGKLDWTAPGGQWKLYALFQGWHGKMVERAGPGGEGNVIDHFSPVALKHYLQRFDSAFKDHDLRALRGFFNDSYEVDDARGAADFTPALFEEFRMRRGYDLRDHLPALLNQDDPEKNRRVLCDYRETISELVLENFTTPWRRWAHNYEAIVRNQAHGSPANILDLYAAVDIPEIEGNEPLRFKMASSSANVNGKKLIAAEAATWLNEHFQSNLADIKNILDLFMLNGVNHLVYHGTAYSPPNEPWPGWLFYAAVHANNRNPLWQDFETLNTYVARCQSFLQHAAPDNDVLLYYPVYDRFSTPGPEMIEHFDGIGKQFEGTSFARCAEVMLHRGYAFDYISDKQIEETTCIDGLLKTKGNGTYKTIVVPHCEFMPVRTLAKIISLAEQGAQVIMMEAPPVSFAGYGDLEKNKTLFEKIIEKLQQPGQDKIAMGGGSVMIGDDLEMLLAKTGARRETMVDAGIHTLRKRNDAGGSVYFINNTKDTPYEGWLPVQANAEATVLYDPMTGSFGEAKIRRSASGNTEVFLQLASTQSMILETYSKETGVNAFPYRQIAGSAIPLRGKWKTTFNSGGPTLPEPFEQDTLMYWTARQEEAYQIFSGTATYQLHFDRPENNARQWLLNIGTVKESAAVFLNGKAIATLIGSPYEVAFDASLLEDTNVLEIKVSNLMANRIAWMDRKNMFWKKFYNINFPARKPANAKNGLFDASGWETKPSGISGPVTLTPLQ